jgi:hypothetical protein
MIQTFETRFQNNRVEVHEKTSWVPSQLQVRDDLRLMNRMESVDRFDFDDDFAFNEEIKLEFALNALTLVIQRHVPVLIMCRPAARIEPGSFLQVPWATHR